MLRQAIVSDKPGGLSVCSHPLPQENWQPDLNRLLAILVKPRLQGDCSITKDYKV